MWLLVSVVGCSGTFIYLALQFHVTGVWGEDNQSGGDGVSGDSEDISGDEQEMSDPDQKVCVDVLLSPVTNAHQDRPNDTLRDVSPEDLAQECGLKYEY